MSTLLKDPLWRRITVFAGGLVLAYALIWVFWGGYLALFPPAVPPQKVYVSGTHVDSVTYFDPQTHAPLR